MKIQDLRSFLAKALVKISCKTQSAQHNKQTKCEYMKGDLMHLFGPLTVSNLLASVQRPLLVCTQGVDWCDPASTPLPVRAYTSQVIDRLAQPLPED